MYDSKLLSLISSLDITLHDKLIDFVASPYFKKSEQAATLVRYIIDIAPNYEDERLRKKRCYKIIFSGEKFEDIKIRRLMSDALKLIERFVLQEQLQVDKLLQAKLLATYYKENNLDASFYEKFQAWEVTNKTQEGPTLFLQRYLMSENYLAFAKKKPEGLEEKEELLQETLIFNMEGLQDFYMFQTMYIQWVLLQQQQTFNKVIKHPHQSFLQKIQEKDVIHNPLIHMYYLASFMMNDPDNEERYLLLRKTLEILRKEGYHKKVLTNMCKPLEMFLVKKSMEGDDQRYVDLLDLYKYEVEHKLVFSSDNYFYPVKFRNIVVIGTIVKDYEWLKDFVEEYRATLSKEQQSTLYPYCKALLCFYQKKYDEAKDLLLQPEDVDNILSLDIKRLQIMIYYEEDEIDLLDSMMNSFRVLIFRDKFLSKNYKEANKSFINMLFQMVRTKPNNHKKIEKMVTTLKSKKSFMERRWLLEKVLEMK